MTLRMLGSLAESRAGARPRRRVLAVPPSSGRPAGPGFPRENAAHRCFGIAGAACEKVLE